MSERVIRNPRLAWREVDGEMIIISPDGQVHELNETATLVWKNAAGDKGLEEIAGQIAVEYDVTLEDARADLAELLAVLEEKQLVLVGTSGKG
jgi:putative ribosome biogenesis GTPase RsgA